MGILKSPVVGTELKIKVGLTVGGTDWGELQNPASFTLSFYTGNGGTVVVSDTTANLNPVDHTYLAIVDTAITGAGTILMKAVIDIYDTDMLDEPTTDESHGYRREVAIYNTGIKVYDE